MQHSVFMDRFSIYSSEIDKSKYKTAGDLCGYFVAKIQNNPEGAFIGIFNHYEHTKAIQGDIASGIQDVKLVVFCFGKHITSTDILAARPRSFSIVDMGDKFIVNFSEPPMASMRDIMIEWVNELKA